LDIVLDFDAFDSHGRWPKLHPAFHWSNAVHHAVTVAFGLEVRMGWMDSGYKLM
jgi:hypothetical protein